MSNLLVYAGFTSIVYTASCLFVMNSCDKCSFKKFLFEWICCFCLNPKQRCCRLSDLLSEYRFHLIFKFWTWFRFRNGKTYGSICFVSVPNFIWCPCMAMGKGTPIALGPERKSIKRKRKGATWLGNCPCIFADILAEPQSGI